MRNQIGEVVMETVSLQLDFYRKRLEKMVMVGLVLLPTKRPVC